MLIALLFPTTATSFALQSNAAVSVAAKPLWKVVRILEDMKAELDQNLKDDTELHAKQICWCKEIPTEASLSGDEQKINLLSSSISENKAKFSGLATKLQATVMEIRSDRNALSKAFDLRTKEHIAFRASKNELLAASEQTAGALQALGVKPSLGQMRAVAHQMLDSRVAFLLSNDMATYLRKLPHRAQKHASFLAVRIAPEVQQVLRKIKEQFDERLESEIAAEKTAAQEFEALQSAKLNEIEAGNALITKYKAAKAEAQQRYSQDAQELKDTEEALDQKRQDIIDMKKICSTIEADWEARLKTQMEEIQAVSDTLGILTSEDSFLSTAESFLQTQKITHQWSEKQKLSSALQDAAGKMRWQDMIRLKASAQMDSFTEVKEMITKLVEELKAQQKADTEQRDWCIKEFQENKREIAAVDDKQDALGTAISKLETDIEAASSEIQGFEEALQKVSKQQREATQIREDEKVALKHAQVDHRIVVEVLKKAINRMTQVYDFLEQSSTEDEGTPEAPPEGAAEYKQSTGGAKVLKLLNSILDDENKVMERAVQEDKEAQAGYSEFLRQSKHTVAHTKKLLVEVTGKKAEMDEELALAKADMKSALDQGKALHSTLGSLHKTCDFLTENYEIRREARTQEIEALGVAMNVLSGQRT